MHWWIGNIWLYIHMNMFLVDANYYHHYRYSALMQSVCKGNISVLFMMFFFIYAFFLIKIASKMICYILFKRFSSNGSAGAIPL